MSPAVSLAPEGQDDLSVEDLDFWALSPKHLRSQPCPHKPPSMEGERKPELLHAIHKVTQLELA